MPAIRTPDKFQQRKDSLRTAHYQHIYGTIHTPMKQKGVRPIHGIIDALGQTPFCYGSPQLTLNAPHYVLRPKITSPLWTQNTTSDASLSARKYIYL